MILKVLLLICLYFVFKNFFKAMRIINQHNEKANNSPKNSHKSNASDDIIDAEYRVIKD